MNIIIIKKDYRKKVIEDITDIWKQSVKETHKFLSNDNVISLIPEVKKTIENIESLIIVKHNNNITGFMGIENNKIEMLFIKPCFFGKGIGKSLVEYGICSYDINCVDVNEQNIEALKFYEHIGFEVIDKSNVDNQGNPFPILHLKIKDKI
jgi:putative acetyltransferase